jgi:hypothetical protein
MGKEKGCNSSLVYCQAKGWFKKSYKNFLNDLEKVFEMVWWRGRKWNHIKGFLKLNYFPPLKILTSPFIWRDSWRFSLFFNTFLPLSLSLSLSLFNTFSSSFCISLFLCSVSWGLRGFDDIRGEKSLLQKLHFKWNGMDWLSVNIGNGRIFWNGVMHANMAKRWS